MIDLKEELVTVFGGGGFIGRYVCESLLRAGARVRVAQRDPRKAHFLQPLAQVGQIGFVSADTRRRDTIAGAIRGATAVINLPGVFGKQMWSVHVEGARNVAEVAAANGVSALVQMSAIGADSAGVSDYARSKGEGEAAVRAAFPNATIIRPSLVFGPEDQLTNRFAAMGRLPLLPVLAAATKFQPVYVRDLAKAIAIAASNPRAHAGKTYEIAGPQPMSMIDLHRQIFALSGQNPDLIELPNIAGKFLSMFGWLPGAPLTADQWKMLQQDNVPSGRQPGLEAFGIEATPLAAVGAEWLGRFNRGGRFAGHRASATAAN
ncbi:complex I NDUFA9 subunit family protein [Sphingomonas lutea]|uniref:Complex I NDUFA9 subunit family protein n=1 Tax=Sphingomonas lutea TaxID=1045317 RepID=A0A7G9SJK4_9SPHN|nr:complex I NDUFA9 subunit family protein [Sphingomonas lutea]QNN68029.1 complex I NDUFA9 subunit family protein [Sphingomonas lutea]